MVKPFPMCIDTQCLHSIHSRQQSGSPKLHPIHDSRLERSIQRIKLNHVPKLEFGHLDNEGTEDPILALVNSGQFFVLFRLESERPL